MSKKKAIRIILLSVFMTCVSAWTINTGSTFGWFGTIFFGVCTVVLLAKFFRSGNKWVDDIDPNSKEFKERTEREFNEKFNDKGIFTFNDNGFTIQTDKGEQNILWTEIKSMLGYKIDRYTIDTICLDVFPDNGQGFKITEETAGWFRFLDHSKKALPSIDKSWEIEISTPAFETKLTVVYDRQNRLLSEVTKEYYKS